MMSDIQDEISATTALATAQTCKDAAEWMKEPDEPDNPLVGGVIANGEMFAIVGQSKVGKSFFVLQMAISIAAGRLFLGRATTKQRVYIANLEVSARQYKQRLRKILEGLQIAPETLSGQLFIDNLKGGSAEWEMVRQRAKQYAAEVVFIDPFYQIFDGSETDDLACKAAVEEMKKFLRDSISLGIVFHAPKGFSGDRQLIDSISGSSILARFPESVIGLLNHAIGGNARVVDAVLRNYPQPEMQTVRFDSGIFVVDADTPPVVASS